MTKNNNIQKLTEIEQDAIQLVMDSKKDSYDFYQHKFKQFNYYDQLYIRGSAKTNTPYGKANLELPLVFQQVEPFVDQMTDTMLGEAPYVAYQGRTAEDEENAQTITQHVQSQFERGGFLEAQMQHFRNSAKYGTAIMKVIWEEDSITLESETSEITEIIDPETGELTLKEEIIVDNEEVITHDGPRFINLSIFDFFVPPSANTIDIQRLPWVIHRTFRSLDELIENEAYESAHSALKKLRNTIDSDDNNKRQSASGIDEQAKRTELNQKNVDGQQKFQGKHEVFEFWGRSQLTKDGPSEPVLIAVADIDGSGPVLLRMDKNPMMYKFKPFIAANDYPISGEFYGYGEIHHIKGLVKEATALRNARLDGANQSLNRMWLIERTAGVNARDLFSAPNKIIFTDDNAGIRDLTPGGTTAASVNEISRIDFDIQNTTEVANSGKAAANMGGAFGDTATGVNFVASRANRRLMSKARLYEETYFKDLALMILMYNKDFITDESFFRVFDKDSPYAQGASVGPDAYATELDYKPVGSPRKLSADAKKGDLGFFIQTIGQLLGVDPTVQLETGDLITQAAELFGFRHPERFIKKGPTTIIQLPDGNLVDQKGNPVEVTPLELDEKGNPIG